MVTIKGLNHVVLWVRDAQRSMAFYRDTLGFIPKEGSHPQRVFMKANGSTNHHDLGLFGIGPDGEGIPHGRHVGMYHVAWELSTVEQVKEARDRLLAAGAYVGENDHGNSLSIYGQDPDGNEFEVFWAIPQDEWETRGQHNRPLDIDGEIARRKAVVV
jgi:catechol-2,3-dioxygenase